ncbi:hypothetical protein CONCODRAFT_3863 [Conidiobolus coronatus NRRL 28638]|uniref:Uncharacterized protein n=1 Tax=Conidiobolus coronatus (strain ATCC 28846 / CBS 209.66 / NRRL 28638) TaxID=796925 RepID=A0A137PE02_CONC2|nr:hypothetical protein CONCODRAFT_3863 [Conidiobolus coronatus NRRL 28638]|eukprot:KXN73195.1 hypothetical protein CONCODRAFT_3863 [Conidiobolus coronatus NRRL 28638]
MAKHCIEKYLMIPDDVASNGLKKYSYRISIPKMLKGKYGIIEQTLMGKKISYRMRSVITPAPDIGIEEVSIPRICAESLGIKEYDTAL